MKIISTFDIEKLTRGFIINYSKEIKLFFILFLITIVIYGEKLFFYTLATDDFSRYYSGGGEQASWLGRWMAGIFNQNIFTGAAHVLPYLNGLLGVFSFTLSGFLTAKFLRKNNVFEISVITLLIAVTPFVAHNFYFNTNTSTWITTLFGVIGLILAYKPNKLLKLFGFSLLVIAIGSYQTILQVTIAMIIIKTIIEVMEANTLQDIRKIVLTAFLYVGFILLAFAASTIINGIYIEYNNLTVAHRYKNAEHVVDMSVYIDRVITMYKGTYNISFGLQYFKNKFEFLYKIVFILGIIGSFWFVIKKNIAKKIKIISISLLLILFASIPLIVALPLITGNGIPTRAHYTIGWFLAGFFAIQSLSFKGIYKTISSLLAIALLVVSIYYVNVFFDAGSRQTSADITRINQIVTRIRTDKNYVSEPLKFKIIGKKPFPVIGWKSYQQALNTDWSKYDAFKNFTDLKFKKMNDKEYREMIYYLAEKNIKMNAYPAKNSIIVYNGKAILVLNSKKINSDIKLSKVPQRTPDIISDFNLYITDKNLYYVKTPCSKEDVKHKFFLHVYPKDKKSLPEKRQKYGFQNMDFKFNSTGRLEDKKCVAYIVLPEYDIKKIQTGQYDKVKMDWDVTYSIKNNSSH